MTKLHLLLGVALAATVACGGSASSDDGSAAPADEQDWVVQSTFTRAYGIVQGIDYLPFQYKVDGCYARALYMSMELAAQGMESNAIFAFARQGTALTVGPIQWGYHVAPMLEVGTDAQHLVPFVIDPALSNEPLTAAQWVGDMGFTQQTTPTTMPYMLIVPGSDYAPSEAVADIAHRDQDTPDFADLPPFKESDVQSACSVMFNYIALEPGSTPETISLKQQKLVTRSSALVAALRGNRKLTEDFTFSPTQCAGGH